MKIWIFALALLLVSPVFADLSANATISPRYVDTNVINQTFVYTIVLLNESLVNRTVITIPAGYNVTNIVDIAVFNESCKTLGACPSAVEEGNITINFTTFVNSSYSPIVVTFTANTSSSTIAGNFTSLLNNSVYESSTTPAGVNYTQVITQQMINVTAIAMSSAVTPACPTCKGTAIANGTDYWEFRLTLSLFAQPTNGGLIQFKMNNWTDAGGKTLNLSSGSNYYATFRNETNFNTTGKFNVTNTYGSNVGVNKTTSASADFYLKMIIPAGTPPSSTWSTAYSFLFRATP